MSIHEKDIKILWAKAAGRCSMTGCGKQLITKASDAVPSKNSLIGENCHIIGEKETSPRGKSILSEKDRNRYPNLILLCRNHHKIIDDDEKTWPIERLYLLKSDHELWVETALTDSKDMNDTWYANIINGITEKFQLLNWEQLSDHAVRNLLNSDFVDGVDDISIYIFKAIFPDTKSILKEKIVNLVEHAKKYVDHYMKNAYLDDNGRYRADKFYKRIFPNPNYHTDSEKYNRWERNCTKLLVNLVFALNEFAEQVRIDFNPNYFKLQGKFVIFDGMGVLDELKVKTYLPEKYYLDEELESF